MTLIKSCEASHVALLLLLFAEPGIKLAIKDPVVRVRELFRSEVTDCYPASCLK